VACLTFVEKNNGNYNDSRFLQQLFLNQITKLGAIMQSHHQTKPKRVRFTCSFGHFSGRDYIDLAMDYSGPQARHQKMLRLM
jgi:hypothetical protein